MVSSENLNSGFKQFSAGFFDQECCFVVQNLPSCQNAPPIPLSVSVAEKMILRGLPTKPSTYLAEELEKYFPGQIHKDAQVPAFTCNKAPVWISTIKGSPENSDNNPAKYFFDKLISEYFSEFKFIKQLILPECNSEWVIVNKLNSEKFPTNQKFDFFLDAADLVIEIDGAGHERDVSQKQKDQLRDNILKNRGIETVRISTDAIKKSDSRFITSVKKILDMLSKNEILNRYKTSFEEKHFLQERYEYTVTAIIRFQILLIQFIRSGLLDINSPVWELNIETDVNSKFNWAELACEDLFHWILPVSKIYCEEIKKPKFKMRLLNVESNIRKDLNKEKSIDFRLFERWDDNQPLSKICVRSDYINKERYFRSPKEGIIISIRDHSEIKPFEKKALASPLMKNGLKEFNKQLFGFNKFKEGQLEIIEKILGSGKTLGLLPTGGGKSLCFHLSASLFQGCCIVVAPIKALMRDQVAELSSMGFEGRAVRIDSSQERTENDQIIGKIQQKRVQFLFVSPERFQQNEFRELLTALNSSRLIGSLVVDEVHCLSEWGHDFRLSYLNLAHTVFRFLPKVPIICLTATASLNVLRDISIEFGLDKQDVVYKMHNSREELGFNILNPNPAHREELEFKILDLVKENNNKKYELDKKSDVEKFAALLSLLEKLKKKGWVNSNKAGIIFSPHLNGKLGCNTIRDDLKSFHSTKEIKTGLFCGERPKYFIPDGILGWNSEEVVEKDSEQEFEDYKEAYQTAFKENKLDLMCVTKAFGMGINKPNIRFTIHYGMPSSLEALYQEGGRAGRDGDKAECYVLFSREKKPIPDKIHKPNVRPSVLKSYSDGFYGGDFKTQLWLSMGEQNEIEYDFAICWRIFEQIEEDGFANSKIIKRELKIKEYLKKKFKKHDIEGLLKDRKLKINVQRAIFRLFQLGIVTDWVVVNPITEQYDVKAKNLSDDQIVGVLKENIGRYEISKSEQIITDEKIEDIKAEHTGVDLKRHLIWYLLNWNYQKFVYNRRQSLKNLYEACMGFEVTGPKKFKEIIDFYFKIDDMAEDIASLVELQSGCEIVRFIKNTLAPDDKLLSQNKIEKIVFSLARYLETYQNNPAYDLMSGICRLITDEFNNADGAPRLVNFVQISQKDTNDWSTAFEDLLSFVSMLQPKYKDQFSAEVCPNLENRMDLVKVHEYLDDDFSAITYLEQYNKQLEKVV